MPEGRAEDEEGVGVNSRMTAHTHIPKSESLSDLSASQASPASFLGLSPT